MSFTIMIPDVLKFILPEISTMIELGNKKTGNLVWKGYFESIGIDHTSIDLNGEDGALALDLGSPIDLPPADVVTNIGTSEHVFNQEACFDNIDRLSKKWMVHVVPLVGNWKGHGLRTLGMECYKYEEDYFLQLAKDRNYEIETLYVDGRTNRKLINCRMRKL